MSSLDDFADQESGGGIDNYVFTVTNAFFAIDDKYSAASGADTHFLHWEGTSDVEDHEVMDRDGFHPKWALDPDWVSMDDGKTVKSQSGKTKLGKAAGRMMGAAANSVLEAGFKDSPESPFAPEAASPQVAATWVGTKWFMSEVIKDFGNNMTARDQMPVKYLGKSDVAAPVQAPVQIQAVVTSEATKAAPVTTTPAPAPVPTTVPVPAAPATNLRVTVEALAASINDHAAFVTAAMATPGVAADAALVGEIVAPDGLWAQAQNS